MRVKILYLLFFYSIAACLNMVIEYSTYMSVYTLSFEHYPLIVWAVVILKVFGQSLIKKLFIGF